MHKIRSKIFLTLIICLLFHAAISYLAFISLMENSARRQNIFHWTEQLETLAAEIENSADNSLALQHILLKFSKRQRRIWYLYVLSPQKRVLADTFIDGVPPQLLQATNKNITYLQTENGNIVDIKKNIAAGEIHLGIIEDKDYSSANNAWEALLIIEAIVLIPMVVVSFLLADLLVKPLRKLWQIILQVRQGNLSVESGICSDDEIGKLAQAFDAMLLELKNSQEKREETAMRSQAIVSSFPNAVLVIDRMGNIIDANPTALELIQIKREDLPGTNIAEIFVSDKEDFHPATLPAEQSMMSYALYIRRKEKDKLPVVFSSAPISQGKFQGHVIGLWQLHRLRLHIEKLVRHRTILEESDSDLFCSFSGQTTEEKEIETYLVRSDRLVSLGQLAASVAHEVNNPLFSIITCARILQRDLPSLLAENVDSAKLFKNIQTILKESTRCSEKLRHFLQYSQIRKSSKENLSVRNLVEEIFSLIEIRAKQNQVEINNFVEPGCVVCGDKEQLKQVFLNIILNALQAMPDGGKITLDSFSAADSRSIVVSDTGPGIAEEISEKVFEPFFTTKENGEGTGMGMAIARAIIHKHQGEIFFTSEQGKGTQVKIVLPAGEKT